MTGKTICVFAAAAAAACSVALISCASPDAPDAAELAKGEFHVETEQVAGIAAALTETWNLDEAGGRPEFFIPLPPELPGQRIDKAELTIPGTRAKAYRSREQGPGDRLFLHAEIPGAVPYAAPLKVQAVFSGVLFSRKLASGPAKGPVKQLSPAERRRYLAATETTDHDAAGFRQWAREQGLTKNPGENEAVFAARVFRHLAAIAAYGGDTSSYEARRPSRTCSALESDCGGLSLLFTALMRAGGVPARTLFGRWALPQTGGYGQYHVIAEFFAPSAGWVPVDLAGALLHRPADKMSFFGNSDGLFIAFHEDTDLEPAPGFRHAWAQYLLLRADGPGRQLDSRWAVRRSPSKTKGK